MYLYYIIYFYIEKGVKRCRASLHDRWVGSSINPNVNKYCTQGIG